MAEEAEKGEKSTETEHKKEKSESSEKQDKDKKNRAYLYILLILAILGIIFFLLFLRDFNTKVFVADFEECSKAGYPISETYPRTCVLPNGTSFTESYAYNDSCSQNSDCILIDKNLGYACCWASMCKEINYSKDKWIAVNKADFELIKEEKCPTTELCGPAPECAESKPLNKFMIPLCKNKVCVKWDSRL